MQEALLKNPTCSLQFKIENQGANLVVMQLPQLLITACITTQLVNCSCNQLARDTPSVQGVYSH